MRTAERTRDRLFFAGASLLLCFVMFAGFARNYYLRVWIGTRPLTLLAHVHGLVMTVWVALFATQTWLIAKRRASWHRALGYWGAGLAVVVVVLGIVTIAAAMARRYPGSDLHTALLLFVAFDGLSVLLFGALVGIAVIKRNRPLVHKRLMLMAILSLLPPAFGRLVAYFTHDGVEVIVLGLMYTSVLAAIVSDAWRTGRVSAALVVPGFLIIAVGHLSYYAQVHT